MNRESMRLLVSNNLNTTSKKNGRVNFMMRPNWQKDCSKHEMIIMVIMMCARSKIINKRLEAVVEAN